MFNLIVKYNAWADGRDTIPLGRTLEYTDDNLRARFKPSGHLDLAPLIELPTLFMQESSGQGTEIARVGTIIRAQLAGANISLEYAYDLSVPAIPNSTLEGLATDLEIADFEFSRTHWAVKNAGPATETNRISDCRTREH
jgi:hypothetical protein